MGPTNKKTLSYGLDFGTSNSSISIATDNKVRVLPLDNQSVNPEIFQSAMYFKNKKVKFASEAVQQYLKDLKLADIAKSEIKMTGEKVKVFQGSDKVEVDQIIEVENFGVGRIMRSFKSALGNEVNFITNITGQPTSFEQLLSIFIKEIKNRADNLLGEKIDRIVIGRPVKFVNDESNGKIPLKHLLNAAKLAGFKEVIFQFEPVAAAYGYGINNRGTILIFDFGGGTLDTSIVNLETNKIISTYGSPIGGDLIDQALYDEYLAKYLGANLQHGQNQIPYSKTAVDQMINWTNLTTFRTQKFFDYLDSIRYLANEPDTIDFIRFFLKANLAFPLRKRIVEAKEELSQKEKLKFVFKTDQRKIIEILEKRRFELSINYLVEEANQVIEKTLKLASLQKNNIDKVVMTGGSSLIPKFQSSINNNFGSNKVCLYEPFTAVSKGLAILSHKIFN